MQNIYIKSEHKKKLSELLLFLYIFLLLNVSNVLIPSNCRKYRQFLYVHVYKGIERTAKLKISKLKIHAHHPLLYITNFLINWNLSSRRFLIVFRLLFLTYTHTRHTVWNFWRAGLKIRVYEQSQSRAVELNRIMI